MTLNVKCSQLYAHAQAVRVYAVSDIVVARLRKSGNRVYGNILAVAIIFIIIFIFVLFPAKYAAKN